MEEKKALPRSTIEFYGGSAIAIILAVFQVTLWLKLLFICFLCGIIIDLICRSPLTVKWSYKYKIIASLASILCLVALSWYSIQYQRTTDHPVIEETTKEVQKALQSEKSQPTSQANENIKEKKQKEISTQETPKPPLSPPKEAPAVALRFVYPESPALIIKNISDSVARDIKWSVVLWNMDLPERNDPLPIPTQTFDWIKGRKEGGPQNLFSGPLVAPLLKPGNRLFGSASVDCPTCTQGRTYVVYLVWKQGGWFSEVQTGNPGAIILPKDGSKDSRDKYFEALNTIPENLRLPIGER